MIQFNSLRIDNDQAVECGYVINQVKVNELGKEVIDSKLENVRHGEEANLIEDICQFRNHRSGISDTVAK